MPCYHPQPAYRREDGSVVFAERGSIVASLFLPCGQCHGCRLERSRQWAIRCMHEAQMHKDNCFITLTYSADREGYRPDRMCDGVSLEYRDFQKFIRRLRKAWPRDKIRFYMCGEYGENFSRPHFHACLFGFNFPDREPLRLIGQSKLFSSAQLTKLWGHGFCSIGEVTFESAAYIARYCMKKINGDMALPHYTDPDTGQVRSPEFNHMSLKPGIGASWFTRFHGDVYPSDEVIVRGREMRPPRYYDKKIADMYPEMLEDVKLQRELDAAMHAADNTFERLAVKEVVSLAKFRNTNRSMEVPNVSK